MTERPTLMDLANSAGELERAAELLIADVEQRGVPNCEQACSDLESAVAALLDRLSEAALADPHDELPVDGGI
jgi:hypothetical protein